MVGWCSMGTFNDPCQHCQSGWNHQEVGSSWSSTTARWTNETYGRGNFQLFIRWKAPSIWWTPDKKAGRLIDGRKRRRRSSVSGRGSQTCTRFESAQTSCSSHRRQSSFGSQDSNPEKPDRRRDLRDMLELRLAICKWMGPCLGDVSGTCSVEISQCGCHCHERIPVELYRIIVFRVRGIFERFVSDVWLFFHDGMVLENVGLIEGGHQWDSSGKDVFLLLFGFDIPDKPNGLIRHALEKGSPIRAPKWVDPNDPTPSQRFRGA